MDGYEGYIQIKMHLDDGEMTAHLSSGGVFCYKVIPFVLKKYWSYIPTVK